MLAAANIVKSFGSNAILNGVDVTVNPGEITCLIGPSGCGKTTLLRALGMLDYPDAGQISIGEQTYSFPVTGKRAIQPPWPQITVVFQSLFLWPHLTLRENIMLPARNLNTQAHEVIDDLIATFEMGHFIDNYPNEASVGQKQRVALARALILNPDYILMDEITSALDIEQTARILTKLADLKKHNIGMLLITHHIGFAMNTADHIIFMDEGIIKEQGGPEILKTPKTARLKQFLSMAQLAA